jgi:hypothetical protein
MDSPQQFTANHSHFSDTHLYFFAFDLKSKKLQMASGEVAVICYEWLCCA